MRESFPDEWRRYGQPFPRRVLDEAVGLAHELGATTGRLLVNWDLHYFNVLAGTREPWLAIDPKVVTGDPELGVHQLVRNRFDELDGPHDLRTRLAVITEAAELDPAKARAWTLVRTVDYWLWALSQGSTIDPPKCETLVDWLTRIKSIR
jgi:streptomycin 6-kinase